MSKLPKCKPDPNLLIGFDSADDAAVYKVSDEIAVVQTVDFFPPMVEDPYLFGKIAATNALSDVYAMGGEVKTAMNIVCFPQSWDINMLGEILRGGSEMVIEAGGVLVGGHSINDVDVKYGLSVMGLVHPDKIYANNGGHPGDKLIITKRLGVGIISTAHRVGEATDEAMDKAIASMTTLNKYAAQCCKKYDIHGCTDITGFGFLGHLHEMVDGKLTCKVFADRLPVFPEALEYADEFLLTAVAQQNRNHVGRHVRFDPDISFAMQEVMYDPQSSGGLLIVLPPDQADALLADIQALGVPSAIVGEMMEPGSKEIIVTTSHQ